MIKHIVMWKFREGEQENMLIFRDRLLSLPSLDTDIDFWILSYRKIDSCAE